MIVAFLASDNTVLNTAVFEDSFDGDFVSFYSNFEGVTSHIVVSEGKVAVIGEKGLKTVNKPYGSWIWDKTISAYLPPLSKPDGDFIWDEATTSWKRPDPLDIPPVSE